MFPGVKHVFPVRKHMFLRLKHMSYVRKQKTLK